MIYLEPRTLLDAAIIGKEGDRLVYSYAKLIDAYMGNGMTYIDAVEWIEFNIIGTIIKDWPIIEDDTQEDI